MPQPINNALPYEIVSKLKEDDFFLESHKLIFHSMSEICGSNKPVDLVTLSDDLEKKSSLEKAGGIEYVTELARTTPSAANYQYYLDIVKRDGTLRKLIRGAEDIIKNARVSSDSRSSVEYAEKKVYDISEELDTSTLTNLNAEVPTILKKFENIQKDKNFFQGLKTGFTGLDRLTNGLHAGNLVILAARPSIGKTTLAMNIVEKVAVRERAVCAVFALERTKEELGQRMMCSVANVSNQDAVKGKLEDDDWRRLWEAQKILNETKCRLRKSREGKLDLIVVDHIQLKNAVKSSDSRQQEVSEISRGLKMIAKELEVPVLALSQLSRLITGRKGQRPMLSDLRESGAIEQDAAIVMFIHRPDLAAEEKEVEQGKIKKNVAEIILAKNRAGECNSFELLFKGEKSKFINPPADYMANAEPPTFKKKDKSEVADDSEDADDTNGDDEDIDDIL